LNKSEDKDLPNNLPSSREKRKSLSCLKRFANNKDKSRWSKNVRQKDKDKSKRSRSENKKLRRESVNKRKTT